MNCKSKSRSVMPQGVMVLKFYCNAKKYFNGKAVEKEIIIKSHNFSFDMVYGEGEHRENRSGGTQIRNKMLIYANTLTGKISEILLYNYLIENELKPADLDFSINKKGTWDSIDIKVGDNNLSVKSSAFFSQFLMLEKNDYDENANYIHTSKENTPDFYILVRIKPDTKKEAKLFANNFEQDKDNLKFKDLISSLKFEYEISGYVSKEMLCSKIKKGDFKRKGDLINGTFPLDADNYVFEVSELCSIKDLIPLVSDSNAV